MTTTVTAQVPQTIYNVLATSTPDVSLWTEIINFGVSLSTLVSQIRE